MSNEGIIKLRTGDWNNMSQEEQPDGSILVTLSSRKYPEIYRFKVKDLYGPNEEVLEEEVINENAQ